ncbi:MAG: cyclic pyranopterin monophosphate synthase MoaC [Cyanobacteria bacterium REEB65]|nr:cyclic pyranopterin monophosphate synthase MoaC [Cyanobacteria bacterium REEB65]
MIPVEDAHQIVRERTSGPLDAEFVALQDLLGRVLAEDLAAAQDIPPFPNSAMDGYAVRSADCRAPGVALEVIGEVAAGSPWRGPALAPGEALRIMTGAPIPPGADGVVKVEDTSEGGGVVAVCAPCRAGDHVRPAGDDVRAGAIVLRRGVALTPARIGLIAALGLPGARAFRRPRVAILCTGEELVDPAAGAALAEGQIWNSNAYGLHAQILEAEAVPLNLGICPDDYETTVARILQALGSADVVLTSGGVSMGRHDHVGKALAAIGEVHFTAVAQQPGKPLTFATMGGKPIFGLPGNPVSTALNFELFVRPALRRLQGHAGGDRPRMGVRLAESIAKRPGKTFYVRATLSGDRAVPTGPQGSARWQSLADADALLILAADAGDLVAGSVVDAIRLAPEDPARLSIEASAQPGKPAVGTAASLTHFDPSGRARMVDVSGKEPTLREAVAGATVRMQPATLELVARGKLAKGDVLAVAQVAGIMGAKHTADWVPMCHPLGLEAAELQFELDAASSAIHLTATVRTTGRTGVEMEALCAVCAAAMTIYDMCKAADRAITISDVRLLEKRGGKSGTWIRSQEAASR